jgi:hypothetical protein
MYSTELISISNTTAYFGAVGFSELVAVGVTTDTSDATADHFTIQTGGAGKYLVCYTLTGNGTNGDTLEFYVHVDGTLNSNTRGLMKHTDSDVQSLSSTAIISLSDGEEISLRVKNYTGGNDFQFQSCQFTIIRVGT